MVFGTSLLPMHNVYGNLHRLDTLAGKKQGVWCSHCAHSMCRALTSLSACLVVVFEPQTNTLTALTPENVVSTFGWHRALFGNSASVHHK